MSHVICAWSSVVCVAFVAVLTFIAFFMGGPFVKLPGFDAFISFMLFIGVIGVPFAFTAFLVFIAIV